MTVSVKIFSSHSLMASHKLLFHVEADTVASSSGVMFDSVLKTRCEITEYGWTKDRAPVDTFFMGLATRIREHNDYEEKVWFLCILSSKFYKLVIGIAVVGNKLCEFLVMNNPENRNQRKMAD
uniref:PI4-kinase N-terminal domain-containing protein n=1 Tax=Lactuca sativa TaxID=4236 RepID=A0A9R1V8X5_LACSA|nr:hypothetical protein LSAT_V11C600330990 [Lactuca sativa]